MPDDHTPRKPSLWDRLRLPLSPSPGDARGATSNKRQRIASARKSLELAIQELSKVETLTDAGADERVRRSVHHLDNAIEDARALAHQEAASA